MTQVTTDPSNVTWVGKFDWILLPGVVMGVLLGWTEHVRQTTANPRARWLVWSPFVFTLPLIGDLILHGATLQGGIGSGLIGMPAIGVIGAYAIGGRRLWARILCGLLAASAIPIWALTATGIGGPSLGLGEAKGLWMALYYWAFLAFLMLACAIALRIPAARLSAREAQPG
jgi:hypothetical protein